MTFEKLGLNASIIKALIEKGYEIPTPIQSQAIPLILNHHDILGCAQTGTGKTGAFALPMIQLLHGMEKTPADGKLQALILTPTRELAIQIEENIQEYSKYMPIKHAVIFGGVNQSSQVDKLRRGVDLLVATPGRLLDLINQGFVKLGTIKLFVLDEADRMLDMGFINDIKKILKLLPEQRQSLFFSATMPENIVQLSNTILKNPKRIEVTPASTTAETIQQELYYTNKGTKNQLLLHLLEDTAIDQALVFTRTKHGADKVTKELLKHNVSASAIHGNKTQVQRQKALGAFKDGKTRILVATDIAARGIDIDKLKFVINYEIPNEPESYVHRIGRSGRAGESGFAISLCEPEENAFILDIQKLIGQKIPVVNTNPFPQTDAAMTEAEKKEANKEKNKRKQEFFANLKAQNPNHPRLSKKIEEKKAAQASAPVQNKVEAPKPAQVENKPKFEHHKPRFNNDRPKFGNNQGRNDHSKTGPGEQKTEGETPKPKSNEHKPKFANNHKPTRSGKSDHQPLKDKYMWPLEK
ncbi:MAG: DEAD/DEAH box helicase [Saprospiraceae bacterium]